jgi:hydroxymethylbilane synthase
MKIGTRGSALALWQARTVARLIQETGGPACEIVVIRTSGDEGTTPPDPPTPPANIKRAFVKEIEDALLDGRVDIAVHSAKDLPGELPAGLLVAAALEREDPRDALLLPAHSPARGYDAVKASLGRQPRIGTSSVRRAAELRRAFSGARFEGIRGNVDTRLRKLDGGACDALVLAVAGVKRLGLEHRISAPLPVDVCLPAPGQGIVAVEIAESCTTDVRAAVKRISDADAEAALLAERAVVQALGGGCQMPLGALARADEHELLIDGVVASLDGRTLIRASARGHRGGAAAVGEKLARQLLAKGAAELLK